MKLPVLESRRAATTLCTYCPKLCRPACPVSTVEGRETVTPWGKMRAMGELLRGVAEPDAAHLAPAYACTGCGACRELCELDNPVADSLRDGRAEAFRLGVAPEGAHSVVRDFEKREAKVAEAARELAAGSGEVAFFPGCTAVTFDRAGLPRVAAAVERLDASCAVVADRCCGLPLLEAGDRAGFVARARAMEARLGAFARVVVLDPGCAHAMREIYPAFGVRLPPVRHLAETAAANLGALAPLASPPRGVLYHDACRLGRGLGVFDQPRAVLAKLLGATPGEFPMNKRHGACSGGGGLLPRTRPASAAAIAREVGALAGAAGGECVVTTCATSRRQFDRAGVRTADFAALVAEGVETQLPPDQRPR